MLPLKLARFNSPFYVLVVGSVLMQSYVIGKYRLGYARNLWSDQPLAPPDEDVITGMAFLVDLSLIHI